MYKKDAMRALFAIMMLAITLPASGQPIEVATATDLQNVNADLDADYIQTANIDLDGITDWEPIGIDSDRFTGTYDGDGFTISNFSYEPPDDPMGPRPEDQVGLFGTIAGATLTDIVLINIDVTGHFEVGGLVGRAFTSTLTGCEVRNSGLLSSLVRGVKNVGGLLGHITGTTVDYCVSYADTGQEAPPASIPTWTGSLIGHIHVGSTVTNCTAYGDVFGFQAVGGLAGTLHGSTMENCDASGNVEALMSVAGGLVGYLQEDSDEVYLTILKTSSASGDVTSQGDQFFLPGGTGVYPANGGLTGWMSANSLIDACSATGTISSLDTGITVCGGLVGFAEKNNIVKFSWASGDVTSGLTCGGLIGWVVEADLIQNCVAFGDVTGEFQIGGLIGAADVATIKICTAYGDVRAYGIINHFAESGHLFAAAGGLVGYSFPSADHAFGTVIECSSAHGDVRAVDGQITGGLVGLCWGTKITESWATGNVDAKDRKLGGLIGEIVVDFQLLIPEYERSEIFDCYATGSVTQTTLIVDDQGLVGGLVGFMEADEDILNKVTNCYSVGVVTATGPDIGGLIGDKDTYATVTSSYWDTETSTQSTSDGGEGKTTAQMQQQSTYVGWDFTNIWFMPLGGYPYLRCP